MNAHVSTNALTGTHPTLMVIDGHDQPLTMSSLEISVLLICRHDNVKRTVERLAGRGLFTLPPMEETSFIDSAGKK
ncbi:hypothetical protein [Stappia stellulata]|uniref:hypothetical protein n=1 Tax=Stappia stellulata TaxID=71235 RepID=UPI000408AFFC|nr:hypothetical protein [Stappia stellulata]